MFLFLHLYCMRNAPITLGLLNVCVYSFMRNAKRLNVIHDPKCFWGSRHTELKCGASKSAPIKLSLAHEFGHTTFWFRDKKQKSIFSPTAEASLHPKHTAKGSYSEFQNKMSHPFETLLLCYIVVCLGLYTQLLRMYFVTEQKDNYITLTVLFWSITP